jgi:hypothetical protein
MFRITSAAVKVSAAVSDVLALYGLWDVIVKKMCILKTKGNIGTAQDLFDEIGIQTLILTLLHCS